MEKSGIGTVKFYTEFPAPKGEGWLDILLSCPRQQSSHVANYGVSFPMWHVPSDRYKGAILGFYIWPEICFCYIDKIQVLILYNYLRRIFMRRFIPCLVLAFLPVLAFAMGSTPPVNKIYKVRLLNDTNAQATLCVDSSCSVVHSGFDWTKTYTNKPVRLSCTYNYLDKYKRLKYANVKLTPTWPSHGKVRLQISGNVPEGTKPYDAGLVCKVLDEETGVTLGSGVIKR